MTLIPVGLCQEGGSEYFQKLLINYDFHSQLSLEFKENGRRKKQIPLKGKYSDLLQENMLRKINRVYLNNIVNTYNSNYNLI